MKVHKEENVPLAKAKNILEKEKKRWEEKEEELLYEQKKAIDHARKFSKLKPKDTEKLIEELSELDLDLTDKQVIKISDLLPESLDDVRAIFAKERFKYDEEEIKKIIDVVHKYR